MYILKKRLKLLNILVSLRKNILLFRETMENVPLRQDKTHLFFILVIEKSTKSFFLLETTSFLSYCKCDSRDWRSFTSWELNIDHNAYSTDLINKKDTKIMASEHLVVLRAVEFSNMWHYLSTWKKTLRGHCTKLWEWGLSFSENSVILELAELCEHEVSDTGHWAKRFKVSHPGFQSCSDTIFPY